MATLGRRVGRLQVAARFAVENETMQLRSYPCSCGTVDAEPTLAVMQID
jgi:hypothetical protein